MKRVRSNSIDNNSDNSSDNSSNSSCSYEFKNDDNNLNLKLINVDQINDYNKNKNSINDKIIICNETPCKNNKILLSNLNDHKKHNHDNICSKCYHNFINNHLLNLHINECHDSFDFYDDSIENLHCFESSCTILFNNHSQRKEHLINLHNYPNFFDFDIVFSGY